MHERLNRAWGSESEQQCQDIPGTHDSEGGDKNQTRKMFEPHWRHSLSPPHKDTHRDDRRDNKEQSNPISDSIDGQVATELARVQVDPDLIPIIREVFQRDLTAAIGHLRPDDQTRIEMNLKAIDEEETRTAGLYASGKITESIWESIWAEWQDRRNKLKILLVSLEQEREVHVNNLDAALKIIAKVGVLYNKLGRSDQKELLGE